MDNFFYDTPDFKFHLEQPIVKNKAKDSMPVVKHCFTLKTVGDMVADAPELW